MLKRLFNFLFRDSKEQVDEAFLRVVRGYANARKAMGAKRYGELAYLERDMFVEATDELIDFMNYMEFQIRKEAFRSDANKRLKELQKLIHGAAKLLRQLLILQPAHTIKFPNHHDRPNS